MVRSNYTFEKRQKELAKKKKKEEKRLKNRLRLPGMINLINPNQTTTHLILMVTSDLGV